MSFKDLKLNKPIIRALEEAGYIEPTLVQEKTIPLVLERNDLITSAQTGTGKTAAFALPILQLLFDRQDAPKKGKKIKALIVSPTRELAVQIGENFKTYGKYCNLRTAVIYGGIPMDPQVDILKKGVDVLIATPGRLLDLHKQELVNLKFVEILVLDEADLMLDLGFIDDVKKIERLCPADKQVLLFSATIPFKVEELAKTILKSPERIKISPDLPTASNVSQILYYVPKKNKMELCLHLLRNDIKGSILIFRRTKLGVEKLQNALAKNGYKVDSLHGDKSQNDRKTALSKFKNNYVNILIATDLAARGIDVKELDAVINFDLPNLPDTYVHRIGRTGRAGEMGTAYSFCSADEKEYIKTIQQSIHVQIPVVEDHPYPLDPKAKPEIHRKKEGSKYKKGRKGQGSKKNKKRWY